MPRYLIRILEANGSATEWMVEQDTFTEACLKVVNNVRPRAQEAVQRETHTHDGLYIPPNLADFAAHGEIRRAYGSEVELACEKAGVDFQADLAVMAAKVGREHAAGHLTDHMKWLDRMVLVHNAREGLNFVERCQKEELDRIVANQKVGEGLDYIEILRRGCENYSDPTGLKRSYHHDLFITLARDNRARTDMATVPLMQAAVESYWAAVREHCEPLVQKRMLEIAAAATKPKAPRPGM